MPGGGRWVGAGVAALVGLLGFCELSDPDLGFHLATGRAILAAGGLPAGNVLTFAEPGHPWLLHQGWPAVGLELAWRAGGVAGVLGLKIAVLVATFALVHAACRRQGAPPVPAALATLLGAFAAAPRFVERPLLFSNLALAAVLWLLSGRPWTRRTAAGVALTLAVAFQLHAGAVFAAGAVLLWAAVEAAARRPGAGLPIAGAAAGLTLGALALAAYHPFGARVLLFPFDMATDPVLAERLVEFRPVHRFPPASFAGYWLLLAALAALAAPRARRLPAGAAAVALVFALAPLRHVRFVDLAGIAAAPLLAAALATLEPRRLRWPAALAFGALAVAAPLHQWSRHAPRLGVAPWVWPEALFDVVRREGLVGPAFVSDVWAGPWLGVFYPRERVFFHASFEAYSRRFAIDEYLAIRDGAPGALERLERYGIALCLLRHTGEGERAHQAGRRNLRQLLARDARWALVALDDTGSIWVRRQGPNASAAARLAIDGLDPDGPTWLRPPREVAPALERALARGPRSRLLEGLLAEALRDR